MGLPRVFSLYFGGAIPYHQLDLVVPGLWKRVAAQASGRERVLFNWVLSSIWEDRNRSIWLKQNA
jgi:hypothetical protein